MKLIDRDELMSMISQIKSVVEFDGPIEEVQVKGEKYEKVRHGKWIHDRMISTSGGTYAVIRCSECMSQYAMWETNYCAKCGALMDGGRNENSENSTR